MATKIQLIEDSDAPLLGERETGKRAFRRFQYRQGDRPIFCHNCFQRPPIGERGNFCSVCLPIIAEKIRRDDLSAIHRSARLKLLLIAASIAVLMLAISYFYNFPR